MASVAVVVAVACGGHTASHHSELGDGAVTDAPADLVADAEAADALDGTVGPGAPVGEGGAARDALDARDAAPEPADGAPARDASLDAPIAAAIDAALDAAMGADTGPSPSGAAGDAAPGACVDVNDDPHNCGVCGHDCLGGGCSAGTCLPFALFTEAAGLPSSIAIQSGRAYWIETEYNAVSSVSVDGGDATRLATPQRPTGLAVNADAIYWTSQGMLQRLPLAGGTPTTIANAGGSYGIALDATNVYWTASATDAMGNAMGSVFSMPLAGGPLTTYSTTEDVPAGIVVTPSNVYWIDLNTELPALGTTSLMEVPLAGGPPLAVVPSTSAAGSGADAIATYGATVYFTIQGTLYSVPVGGSRPTLLSPNVRALALAVDGSGIYAAASDEVLFVPLAGGTAVALAQGLFSTSGIAVDESAIYFTDDDTVMKLAKPAALASVDGGSPTPTDDALTAVLAECSGARDAFYVDQTGPTSFGGAPLGVTTNTNLDTTWTTIAAPTSVQATASVPVGVLGGGVVGVTTAQGLPIAPGVYAQPINATVARPYLNLTMGGIDLTVDGGGRGSFLVQDVQVNAAGDELTSWVIAFDITLSSSRFLGCMRYAADPVDPTSPDGVTEQGTPLLDGVSGAELLAPCTSGTELYMERTGGYPGVLGITKLTPANASFGAGTYTGGEVDLGAQSGDSNWQITATTGLDAFAPGVYSASTSGAPSIQIGASPGGGCTSYPTGAFGVSELVPVSGNPDKVSQTALWFDLQCSGVGSLRGCAIYGN
jgi:hypothetical protein